MKISMTFSLWCDMFDIIWSISMKRFSGHKSLCGPVPERIYYKVTPLDLKALPFTQHLDCDVSVRSRFWLFSVFLHNSVCFLKPLMHCCVNLIEIKADNYGNSL